MSTTSSSAIGSFNPRSLARSLSESVSGVLDRSAAHSPRVNFLYAANSSDLVIGACLILERGRTLNIALMRTFLESAAWLQGVRNSDLGVAKHTSAKVGFWPDSEAAADSDDFRFLEY